MCHRRSAEYTSERIHLQGISMPALIRNAFALTLGLFVVTAFAARGDSDITIHNDSSWVLTELYLSSIDDDEWGPDQLGDEVIESGEQFTLSEIPCEVYDVRVVDEDDDVCILNDVALCNHTAGWHINDEHLLDCQADSDE